MLQPATRTKPHTGSRQPLPPVVAFAAPAVVALAIVIFAAGSATFAAADASQQDAAALTLPTGIDDDVITQHLRAGEFDEALDVVATQLERSGQLSLRLYQQGMAHLGRAEQTGDVDAYKSAGLSFMRVLVYFPRSRYAGYAEVELGYVHASIDRPDIARRLYDRARPAMDEERDPDYYNRLMQLIEQLPD